MITVSLSSLGPGCGRVPYVGEEEESPHEGEDANAISSIEDVSTTRVRRQAQDDYGQKLKFLVRT